MQNRLKRHWPLWGIGILVIAACFYLIKSGKTLVKQEDEEYITVEEGLKLRNFKFVQRDPEKDINWTVNASEMISSMNADIFNFSDFHIEAGTKDGQTFEISGDHGRYAKDSGQITLEGNLKGVSDKGYELVTDSIQMDEKKGLIFTHDRVEISGPGYLIKGQGLMVEIKKETARILSDVSTVIHNDASWGR